MPISNWLSVNSYIAHADFTTHLNYVACLAQLSVNITLQRTNTILTPITESPILRKKAKLIQLTYQNINDEYKKIRQFKDYAQICISWMPVKSYYLYFNLLLLTEYLIEGSESWLTARHNDVNKRLIYYLTDHILQFSKPEFNCVYPYSTVHGWFIPTGNNALRDGPLIDH